MLYWCPQIYSYFWFKDEKTGKELKMEINWIRLGKEVAQTQNGFAILRLLQSHGITHFVQVNQPAGTGFGPSCTVEMVIDYAHKEK